MEVEKSLQLGLAGLEWILSRIKQIWAHHKIFRIAGYTTAVFTTHYALTKLYRKKYKLPDGPIGFPLIGALPYCIVGTWHPSFYANYGPLTWIQLPMRGVVVINHPKLLKKIINTYTVNDRPPDWDHIIVPHAMKSSNGAQWGYHRSVFLKWVRRRSTVDAWKQMWKKYFNEYVTPLLIDKAKRNENVVLHKSFVEILLFDAFFGALTGADLTECKDITYEDKRFVLDTGHKLGAFWMFAFGPYVAQYINRPFVKTGLDLIEKYIDRFCGANDGTNEDNNSKSFIPMARYYLNEIERTKDLESGNDEKLTHEILYAQGFEIFFAEGSVRQHMEIGILILAKYPLMQQLVFKELNSVFDNDPSAFEYNPKTRSKMPLFRAMILEMFRIASNNEGTIRQVTGYDNGGLNIDWDGREYFIPNGTTLTPNLFHFSNCVAPYTREVNLNHWLNDKGQYCPVIQHPSFGIGQRSCAGRQIGEQGMRYFFGQLILNFEVIPVDGNTDFEIPIDYEITTPVTIVPRKR